MKKPIGYDVELVFEVWCRRTKAWVRCRCKFKSILDMHAYIRKHKPEIDWDNTFHVVDYYYL